MITESAYTKVTTYLFRPGGDKHDVWAVTGFDESIVEFEETRKNGQEDTHMSGVIELKDGKWVMDEWARDSITMYAGAKKVEEIEAFFNERGVPPQDALHRVTLEAARDAVEGLESGRMTAGKLTATELLTRMLKYNDV